VNVNCVRKDYFRDASTWSKLDEAHPRHGDCTLIWIAEGWAFTGSNLSEPDFRPASPQFELRTNGPSFDHSLGEIGRIDTTSDRNPIPQLKHMQRTEYNRLLARTDPKFRSSSQCVDPWLKTRIGGVMWRIGVRLLSAY
jgi:hypothetical protein